MLAGFWRQGKNAPQTTAAGRLFDAAAALGGVCKVASFEGQGPMLLEALAATHGNVEPDRVTRLELTRRDGIYQADWTALIPVLLEESVPVAVRAAQFHFSMAASLLQQAIRIREDTGVNRVGLAGGVFQNRVLTERCIALLLAHGFAVTFPSMLPVNDGGISFGQIIEYGYTHR